MCKGVYMKYIVKLEQMIAANGWATSSKQNDIYIMFQYVTLDFVPAEGLHMSYGYTARVDYVNYVPNLDKSSYSEFHVRLGTRLFDNKKELKKAKKRQEKRGWIWRDDPRRLG